MIVIPLVILVPLNEFLGVRVTPQAAGVLVELVRELLLRREHLVAAHAVTFRVKERRWPGAIGVNPAASIAADHEPNRHWTVHVLGQHPSA